MPKGSVPRPGAKKLKARPIGGGVQLYTRGDTAGERYMTARKAVDTADAAGGKGRYKLSLASLYEGGPVAKQLVNKTKRETKLAAVRRPKTLAKQKAPVGKGGR